jgi:putative flippase GtrA
MAELSVELGRVIRFGIVGVGATITYVAASLALTHLFTLSPVAASIVAQVISMPVSYFGHLLYSFRVEADHRTYVARFLFTTAAAFAVNFALTWTATVLFGWPQAGAVLLVSIAIPIASFLANRFWVFLPGLK